MQICDILGVDAPYAARIIIHLSVVSSRQRSIMIGEDVKKEKRDEEGWYYANK